MHGLAKEYDMTEKEFSVWRDGKTILSRTFIDHKHDLDSIVWRGTRGEVYDALRNPRYNKILHFYYLWIRGLYQLPPYMDAPYRLTETFNLFKAYGGS